LRSISARLPNGHYRRGYPSINDIFINELVKLRLAARNDPIDGYVIRQRKVYPVHGEGYEHRVDTVRNAIAKGYRNIHLVGRNGMLSQSRLNA
jgi:protoporphyrinogen oxidase